MARADGANITQLSDASTNRGWGWSPDGTRIAFTSDRDGDDEVFVMNADGTNIIQLTNNDNYTDIGWLWSPDGTRALILSITGDPTTEVFMANTDGTGIIHLAGHGIRDPAWSPDSTRLLYSASPEKDGDMELFIVGTG